MPTGALRNHAGQHAYFGIGRYDEFLSYMSFRPFFATLADKVALKLQRMLGLSSAPEKFMQLQAVKALQRDYGRSFISALFYNRDAHAVASVAGFVRTDSGVHFVKIFKYAEEAIFQKFQADFVAQHFNGPFLTMAVTESTPFALLFQFSRRKRDIVQADHVERKLLHVSEKLLREQAIKKNIAEMIPLDLGAVLTKAGLGNLLMRIQAWRDGQTQHIDVIPVHGDMTPLNIFVNDEEKHVIVNYERAGWHVAYYDYLHYSLNKKRGQRPMPVLNDLSFDIDYPQLDAVIVLYLIDQLYLELSLQPSLTAENGFGTSLPVLINWLQAKIAVA